MKKILSILCVIALFTNCQRGNMQTSKLTLKPYPNTFEDSSIIENYHGTQVADPYRWLEFDTAENVKAWVKDENDVTQNYLQQIPFRDKIRNRLKEIWNFPRYSAPFKEGDYVYFYKNNGLQNQSVLYRQKLGADTSVELFLDPNTLSDDGTTALSGFTINHEHTYAALSVSNSGSDWNEIFVMDTKTLKRTNDHIKWVKFSSAVWYKNGFYYSRYDEPKAGKEFSNQNRFQKVYYHVLGTEQSADQLVFEDKEHPMRYFNAQVSEDEQFLFINVSEGTSGSEILFKPLNQPKSAFKTLAPGFSNNHSVIEHITGRIYVLTDLDAPNYRLVAIDPLHPEPSAWKDVIATSDVLLESVASGGGKLFATYLKDASSKVYQLDLNGKIEKEIQLPGIGTSSGFGCKANENEFYYSFVTFTNPGAIFKYSIETGESVLFRQSEVRFDPNLFETKQVFYSSKDGTKIPMFIIHKKGIVMDGNNPTLLYGYGGFNISLTPSFSVSRIFFLEQGGVYAIANLRGGGEYGEKWHQAGMLEKKQNVFDDFIAAAEYLCKENYTKPAKLAIHGGSNGGLLVGACMTQRPDLYRVAIPAVGVLDMLRYHTFTIGWGWAVEYGRSDSADQFAYLYKYSPLHHVKAGTNYPATLIMTADHDDRVVPAHSFKFAATLQKAQAKDGNPIFIRIDSKAGHGAGKPTAKLIDDATDLWSFVLWNVEHEVK